MRRAFLLTLVASAALAAPAARGQSFLGRPTSAWMNDLKDNDPDVRRAAAFALGKVQAGSDTKVVIDALTHSLRDKDPGVRDVAASALGDVLTGLNGATAVFWAKTGTALQKALKDDEPRVRRSAAVALGAFGPTAAPARDDLVAALGDPSALVRQNAAYALGKLGNEAGPEAVAQLRTLLKDGEPLVRRDALHALGEVGNPTAHPAVPAMLQAAGAETDGVVRKAAVEALSKLVGKEDGADAPALYPLLKDKDSETRYNAAFVLGGIGGTPAAEALPVLREALKDDDPHFQEQAAAALGGLGKDAAPAVPDLGQALVGAKEPRVRINAALSLAAIGPPAKAALPQILQAVQANGAADPGNDRVREEAAYALVGIGMPGAESAIPALLQLIPSDPDAAVRQRCLWALFPINDLEKYKIPAALTPVLDETDPSTALVRYDAARLLAHGLRDKAPDKTADVLLDMLTAKGLVQFNGTTAQTAGVGTEGASGKTEVKVSQGDDARWMAAQALGWMGRKAKRPEVIKALEEASQGDDAKLKSYAQDALKAIR